MGSQNSRIYLHHIYVFAALIKGCRACTLSLLQSLSCLALHGAAQTHTEKAFSPNNTWSDQRLTPKGNKRAGFTPGLVSSPTLRLQIKTSYKVKQFVITVLFTQAGTSSKESPLFDMLFLLCAFPSQTLPSPGGSD